MEIKSVREQAKKELRDEAFREAVEAEKTRIKSAKWWHPFVPFVITIQRRK